MSLSKFLYLGIAYSGVSLTLFLYLANVWTALGLYADVHFTGGYTTTGEDILMITAIILALASAWCFFRYHKNIRK